MSETHGFNTNKVFYLLFAFTAAEVAWAELLDFPRWAMWGGLLLFAYMKGHLIFTYFMHMKFEGWIVKGLIAPTVPLVAIVIFANMPDTSRNDLLVHPLTTQHDPESGEHMLLNKTLRADRSMKERDLEPQGLMGRPDWSGDSEGGQ